MTTLIQTRISTAKEEISEGKASSFGAFYQDNYDYLRNLLYRFGVDAELEDVIQDAFLQAWQSMDQFEGRANIKSWLTRIAINKVHEFRRKKRPLMTKDGQVGELVGQKPSYAQTSENRQLVSKALEELTFEHRVVLVLVVMEGYSLEEASEIIKIPAGTVKSRLSRARNAMKEALVRLEESA